MNEKEAGNSAAVGASLLIDGLGVAVNNIGVVSCCPECWFKGGATMIEASQNDGFVYCPYHGEMTVNHFLSRMTELGRELAGRSQQNQRDTCSEGRP